MLLEMAHGVPDYLITEETHVRYFQEVDTREAGSVELGDSVDITVAFHIQDNISQRMLTIVSLSILGFVGALVGGVASGMFGSSNPEHLSRPKGRPGHGT